MSTLPKLDDDGEPEPRLHEANVVHIEHLTVIANNVTVGKKIEESPATDVVRRYRINAALLAVFAFLILIWFELHLKTWVTQRAVFGTATIWALGQFILSFTKKDLGDDADKARKRLLGREETRDVLLLACAAAVILLLFTSSIYVKLDDRTLARVRLDLIDEETKKPFMDSLVVEPQSSVDGRLFFPRFFTRKVGINVVDPAGYEYKGKPIVLEPWSGIELPFGEPDLFAKKKLHAIRVVPGLSFNGMGDPGVDEHSMTVAIGKEKFTVSKCLYETVYLGVADGPILEHFTEEKSADPHFIDELMTYLHAHPGTWEKESDYTTPWKKGRPFPTTRDFQEGESVVVTLGPTGKTPTATSQPIKIGSAEVTTIFLEKP